MQNQRQAAKKLKMTVALVVGMVEHLVSFPRRVSYWLLQATQTIVIKCCTDRKAVRNTTSWTKTLDKILLHIFICVHFYS
jgi:hypothetical protein